MAYSKSLMDALEERSSAYSKALMDALDRLHCGGLVLDKQGRVIEFNGTAQQVLRRELQGLERSKPDADWVTSAVERLGLRAMRRSGADDGRWLMTDSRPLAVHSIPLDGLADGGGRALVMVDLSVEPKAAVLEKLFNLTPAEATLAVKIGQGKTPAAVARSNGVTISTVRSQLAAVFAKTNTQRQAELVALLARVSLLPDS
jgi:DNA-binding CsgD family transcriptional regulator